MRIVIREDNDGHLYLIPVELEDGFEDWVTLQETGSYDEIEYAQESPSYIEYDEFRISGGLSGYVFEVVKEG